jgi:hypothetical protein
MCVLYIVMGLIVSDIVMNAVLLLCVFSSAYIMGLVAPDTVMYAVILLCE